MAKALVSVIAALRKEDNDPQVILAVEGISAPFALPFSLSDAVTLSQSIATAVGEAMKMLQEELAKGEDPEQARVNKLAAQLEEYAKAHPQEGASC